MKKDNVITPVRFVIGDPSDGVLKQVLTKHNVPQEKHFVQGAKHEIQLFFTCDQPVVAKKKISEIIRAYANRSNLVAARLLAPNPSEAWKRWQLIALLSAEDSVSKIKALAKLAGFSAGVGRG